MNRLSRFPPPLWKLGGPFVLMAVLTWRRSGDPLIDWGRELYTALSVSQGRGIPPDVLALFGPVSPLLNGAVLHFVVEDTAAILVLNLAFLVVALVAVYDIANRLFGRQSAFHAALLFMLLSGFPQLTGMGNFSFLTPYSHGATHGLVLGLLCLATMFRGLRSGAVGWWLLAGVSSALAMCSKPEVGLAALLTLVAGLLAAARIRPGESRHAAAAIAGFVLTVGLVAISVWQSAGASPLVLLEPYRNAVRISRLDLFFYRWSNGVATDLRYVLTGLAVVGALTLTILWPARDPVPADGPRRISIRGHPLLLRVAIVVLLLLLFDVLFRYAWLNFAAALPWFSIAALLSCVSTLLPSRGSGSSRRQERRAVELGLLSLYSCLMLLKLGLRTRFHEYGFVMSAPAVLLTIGILFHDLPARARLIGSAALRMRIVAPAVALFLSISAASQSAAFYSRRTVPLRYGSDLLYITSAEYDARTPTILRLFSTLADSDRFREGAVILPEGSMLHYVFRTPSAVPLASLMPLELQIVGPQNVLRMVRSSDPKMVVIAERNLAWWYDLEGPEGHPYGTVREWIERQYCVHDRFGNGRTDRYRLEVTILHKCGFAGDLVGSREPRRVPGVSYSEVEASGNRPASRQEWLVAQPLSTQGFR